MTQAELYKHLKSIGMPVKYHHFDVDENNPPPSPPYLIYLFSYSSDIIADNTNYVPISNFQVELYTKEKDLATEKLVENKFRELEMAYSKMEFWIEKEKLYQIVYQIQLI